jgi:hypothetical protein
MVTPAMIMGASIQEVSGIKTYEKEQRTIQVLGGDRERVGREQDSDNPAIPEDTDELERLTPAAETPLRLREPFRSAQQPTQTDQTVSRSTGNTSCRDERSESRGGWKNGASDYSGDSPDNNNCVPWLTVLYTGNPTRKGEYTITGNGKDKARGSDDGNCGVLRSKVSCEISTHTNR